MLYSEFVENVGCRENAYNYKVYKALESLYMENDNLTKEDIYKTAKNLVNNSKSQEQIDFEYQMNERIKAYNADIAFYEERISITERFIEISTEEEIKEYKRDIKIYKQEIKKCKQEINKIKWVLK